MMQSFLMLLVLLLLLLAGPAFAGEPEAVTAVLDAIAARTGVRPQYRAIQDNGAGGVIIEGLALSLRDPVEANNRNETAVKRVTLDDVSLDEAGRVHIGRALLSGVSHDFALFDMGILSIEGKLAELGMDTPGTPGLAAAEHLEAENLELTGLDFAPGALFSPGGFADLGLRSLALDAAAYATGDGPPLILRGLAFDEPRKRSAGRTWRFSAKQIGLNAAWLKTLGGTAFSELGYDRLDVALKGEASRSTGGATLELVLDAGGAFTLLLETRLGGLAGPLGASIDQISAQSPGAALQLARAAYSDRGLARRAMQVMTEQTGAAPRDIAAALAAQAGSVLRQAGYRRFAAEAAQALGGFLANPGILILELAEGPLAALSGLTPANGPARLEAAGLSIREGR